MPHRSALAVLVGICALLAEESAHACGGTFCDRPPPGAEPMAVDQRGENVVFLVRDGFVEAHVQIQYTGDPERFAWLVPLPAVPELSVGSQRLFDALLSSTVPTTTLNRTFESCSDGSTRSSGGCSFGMSSDDDGAAFDDSGPETDVVDDTAPEQQQVGAFDVTILEPTAAEEVTTWLDDNDFLDTPDAPGIVQQYIDEGSVFVAVKFRPGAGVNEIHPLVFRYAGSEPCIPIRLTRIAATEDMPIRAFFLGERRVVPTNYAQAELNPVLVDWEANGQNYLEVVTRAVDVAPDGLGFVTEFGGASSAVDGSNIHSLSWNAEVFRSAAPTDVIDLLSRQGLVTCPSAEECRADHPLVLPIVRKYLPAPEGLTEGQFYSCLSCAGDLLDLDAWDGDAFADEIDERVIAPGLHATEALSTSPYVTRLLTTLSPSEMTVDPMFAQKPGGFESVSLDLQATLHSHCAGATGVRGSGVPDYALEGRPGANIDDMPDALRIETYDDDGSLVATDDRTDDIERAISAWNDEHGYPPPPPTPSSSRRRSSCTVGTPDRVHQGQALALLALAGIARRRARRNPRRPRARP